MSCDPSTQSCSDLEALSREDKIELLLGEADPADHPLNALFGINSWVPLIDFPPSVTAQLALQGGATIVVKIGTEGPLDLVHSTQRIALVWDDEVVELETTSDEDTTLVARVGPPRGARLTLWGDSLIDAHLVQIGTPGQANDIQKNVEADNAKDGVLSSIGNAIKAGADKVLGAEKDLGTTAIMVGGAVLLLFLFFHKEVEAAIV